MKCCILRMTEVHTLLFQFKFFYSLNISCAKSLLFRNYAFRNLDVTLQVCPRSNFPLKQKILHADVSSVTFPDAQQSCLLAEGMKNFIQDVTRLQSSKKIKCKHFFSSGPPLSARPQIFCACTLPCNYHCYYSALLLFDGVDGTQLATRGATGQEKRA